MWYESLFCCCSLAKLCLALWDLMDCSTPGLSVLHYLLEFAQTPVHWVGDAIQPSYLLPPSPAISLLGTVSCWPTPWERILDPKEKLVWCFSCEFHLGQLQFYLAWNLPSPSWENTEMCVSQYRKPPETELIILRNECSLHPLLIGPQIPLWYLSCGYRSLMDKHIFKNEENWKTFHFKKWGFFGRWNLAKNLWWPRKVWHFILDWTSIYFIVKGIEAQRN